MAGPGNPASLRRRHPRRAAPTTLDGSSRMKPRRSFRRKGEHRVIRSRRSFLAAALAAPSIMAGVVLRARPADADTITIRIGALKLIHSITPWFYERFVPAGVQIVAIETPQGSLMGYDPKTYVEVSFFGEDDTRSNMARLVTERFTKIINVPNAKEHQASASPDASRTLRTAISPTWRVPT